MKKMKSLLSRFFFWVASLFEQLAGYLRRLGSKTSPQPRKSESRDEVRGMKILYPEEREEGVTDHRGQKQPSFETGTNTRFRVTTDDLDDGENIKLHPEFKSLLEKVKAQEDH